MVLNCTTGTLAPYVPSAEQPWDKQRVQHLYRRLSVGIGQQRIEAALAQSPNDLVDQLIDEAINIPLPEPPFWAEWTLQDYRENRGEAQNHSVNWTVQWVRAMLQNGLREKLALFWHNHFVTELAVYNLPPWQYQYLRLLRQHGLGNFKDFVHAIGNTPAMLYYLNGYQNIRTAPNENYARELYELFTMGRDNGYTQEDIEETARALTGWTINQRTGAVTFRGSNFDRGNKTIFGQTGNWGYDEVHDILFEQRGDQIAQLICTKLYTFFVNPTADTEIIAGMVETFLQNNFQIAPVLRQLFKSEHFFDQANIGVIVKSPIDLFLATITEMGARSQVNNEFLRTIIYYATVTGQRLFNPPDVSGWKGDRLWIDGTTLPTRWRVSSSLVFSIYENAPQLLIDLALALAGDTNDPYEVTQSIIDFLLPNGFHTPEAYDRANIVFKAEIPENYFEDGSWDLYFEYAPAQIALLLDYLFKQPEFQLA